MQSFRARRERLNPFTVEWAVFGVEQRISNGFRMSGVFVDQKEIARTSPLLVAIKDTYREGKLATVQMCICV